MGSVGMGFAFSGDGAPAGRRMVTVRPSGARVAIRATSGNTVAHAREEAVQQNGRIFCGAGKYSEAAIRHVKKEIDRAFSLLSGTQQPPRPGTDDMSAKEWLRQVREDEREIEGIVREVARALTGKAITIPDGSRP